MIVTLSIVLLALVLLAAAIGRHGRRLRRVQPLETGAGITVFDATDYAVSDDVLICTRGDGSTLRIPGSSIVAWASTGQGSGAEEYELLLRDQPTTFLPDTVDNELYEALVAIAGDRNKSTE